MKRILILFLILACAPRYYYYSDKIVDDPAREIGKYFSKNVEKFKNKRIACAEFTDLAGNQTPEAKLFTERITTELSMIPEIELIERTQLEKVLREQNFSHSGIVDSKTAQEMGKILGVDVIICGTVADVGRKWEINVRAIEVKTGKIILGARVKARREAIRYIPEKKEIEKKQEFELESESPSIIGEKKGLPPVELQKRLLQEAKRHEIKARRFKKMGKPALALKEAEIEMRILKRIIEINPETPPAKFARRRIEALKRILRRKLR